MTIVISEQLLNTGADGKIGTAIIGDTGCLLSINVNAKTTTSVWVEFSFSGGSIVATRDDAIPFVNGIQMNNEIIDWTVVIDQYVSLNTIQNTSLAQVVVTMKDVEGGSVIDQKTISRYHAGVNC